MGDFVVVGKVIKPQGIKGQIKVLTITDDPNRFLKLRAVYKDDVPLSMRVLFCDVRGDFAYMYLDGITTREAAEGLRGKYLSVIRENAVKPPEGRYLIADLIGCRVVDEQGNALGILDDIFQHGAADVYSVKGQRDFSFPAVKQVILSVDIEKQLITLDSCELDRVSI